MANRTPLFEKHLSMGAKMAEFAGWDMPIFYKGIIDEHNEARNSCAIFDIGHMGQIETASLEAIQELTTNDATLINEEEAQYSLLCDESGGIIDDILIYRLRGGYLIIANAVNADIVFGKFKEVDPSSKMLYSSTAAIAIQGPKSEQILQKFVENNLSSIKHRKCIETKINGAPCILSRSGYTGEDGFEIFLNNKDCLSLWTFLLNEGAHPAGLGCRDTLRLEAGLPLYGHELSRDTNPYEAGLSWAVKLEKPAFTGKNALSAKKYSIEKKLFGFEIHDKSIPRQGNKIYYKNNEFGYVTSGTFSPTLKKPIGMAYLNSLHLPQAELQIEIRNNLYPIKIVKLPFYRTCRLPALTAGRQAARQ